MKNFLLLVTFFAIGIALVAACKNTSASGAADNTAAIKNAGPESTPAKKKTQAEKDLEAGVKSDDYEENSVRDKAGLCDLEAYVVDKDTAGLNIRDEAKTGKVIGKIPFDEDGTIVHLISTDFNGWVQIDHAETIDGKVVFDKKGWVSANLLATMTSGYGSKGVKLYESAPGSKVIAIIPPETEVRMFSCDGKRPRVVYKKSTGWLNEDTACPNPVTNCN